MPIKTPHTDITADHTGFDSSTGLHSYVFTNAQNGAQETTTSAYGPEDTTSPKGDRKPGLKSLMGSDLASSRGQGLASTFAPLFEKLRYKDQRGFFKRVVAPNIRRLPAFAVGGVGDVVGLLSYVPGPEELVAMGYEAATGDDPLEKIGLTSLEDRSKLDKKTRKAVEETYGSEATSRSFQKYIRSADRYAKDNWGFEPFESTIGTDMTPEARGTFEKLISTGLEFGAGGAAAVKGIVTSPKLLQDGAQWIFAKFAKESVKELGEDALKPENVRTLIDKASDAYSFRTKAGRRNLRGEVGFGLVAGAATESAMAGLENLDPNAADWVKATTAIGAGLLAPMAGKSLYTGLLQGPVVALSKRIVEPLFKPSTTAARYTQKEGMGKSAGDRENVASVARLLLESIANGRHVDQASGLAFTTPELARTESNILRANLEFKRERLDVETDLDVRKKLQREIEADESNIGALNQFANFQERILIAAGKDTNPAIATKFFQNEAKRLVKRREQFFNYIENNFKKSIDDLDFGGKPEGTLQELRLDYENAKKGAIPEFENTRRKLVMEGDPKGVEASELAWLDPQTSNKVNVRRTDLTSKMDEAFENAQKAAEDRVKFWEEGVQSYLADKGLSTLPDSEKALVGDLIRGTYNDAYREFRAFEKAAYRRIGGLNDKVTDNIVFPEGAVDPINGSDISGLAIDGWATSRLENLSRSERFNLKEVPAELAQLAGSRSVLAELNRSRSQATAEGRALATQSRIPDLERTRDDAIARRKEAEDNLDKQLEKENLEPPVESASLRTARAEVAKLEAELKQIPTGTTIEDPTVVRRMNAANQKLAGARAKVESLLETLPSGGPAKSSDAVRTLGKEVDSFSKEVQEAQSQIDKLTRDFLGATDDVVIEPTGRLTSRDADGELVSGGVSANDVKETISDVAESARREVATNGKTPKYRNLLQLRETLEQLLSPETFSTLDPSALAFGREASRIKNRVDDAQGDVLAKTKGSAVKIPVEEVAAKVLPESVSPLTRAANLRLLNEATTELPSFVTINRSDDGKIITDPEGIPVAAIDEAALLGEKSLFDNPDSPFQLVQIGEAGTPFEIRIKPDAPVSPRSLTVAESILLERLALRFPDGVDSKRIQTFKNKNKEALQFLEKNGSVEIPKMLEDADGLAAQLDALNTLRKDKTRQQLSELINNGQLNLDGLTIDDYLGYIGSRRRLFSEENALSEVIKADAGYATEGLFDRVLSSGNKSPTSSLNEFLSVVKGNRPAEKGLQASIIGELFRRSSTSNEALVRQTGDLAASAFDPAEFRNLMSNPRVRSLLQGAFPDNPQLLDGLDSVAKVAFETSVFTKGGSNMSGSIDPNSAVSTEAWSNLGRILGLQVADRIGFINSLVAAGAGGRAFRDVGKQVTGNKIKDILINAALDPKLAVNLAKETADLAEPLSTTIAKSLINAVNVPGTVARRPGAATQIFQRGEQELDEEERIGPQSSLQRPLNALVAGTPQQVASAMPPPRAPNANSILGQVNPVGPPPMAQAPQANVTPQQMADLGLDLFAAKNGGFVEKSGIMSVKPKARQLVG